MTANNVFMFVDETGIDLESKILAIACIITSEPGNLRNELEALKRELIKNKRLKDIPSIKNLKEKGFHYCEDHQDVRPQVIDLIAKLPFEAYIYYKHKSADFCPSDGFDWYDKLFGKLMYDRLQKHKKSPVSIYFEQHGKSFNTREQELEKVIQRLVHEIKSKDPDDFPSFPVVKSAEKRESCLSVADYVAAVFKDYENALKKGGEAQTQGNPSSWQARHFSMLRPKIRVIHNYETGEFFTRKNPFP